MHIILSKSRLNRFSLEKKNLLDKSNEKRYFRRVYPGSVLMTMSDFISILASQGRYHFTTREAAQALNTSETAVRAAVRRLKRKNRIASPYSGFYVIVPPEYQRLGCLPPEQFIPQLMQHLGRAYYVGLISAARYHGAAHQQPLVFQVIVQKNRPEITCGEVHVRFVARHNADKVPTIAFNTPRGRVDVSTPEATAFDLIGYPDHAGGLDNVAAALDELMTEVDPGRLVAVASLSPVPWAQRLGYVLSLSGSTDCADELARYVERSPHETVPLDPRRDISGAPRDSRWKIIVNVKVEPEL